MPRPRGGADGDLPVRGAQGDGAADGLGDVQVALLGADLGGSAQAADGDVPGEDGELGARGLVELDGRLLAVEDDVTEPSDAPEFGAGRLHLDTGAGGQLDGQLDRSGGAEDPVARLGGLDPQDSVGVGDLDPLGRLDVAALGGVRGQDLDHGVGPVGGDEPDVSGGDVDDGRDGGGGGELLHRFLLGLLGEPLRPAVSDMRNATLHSRIRQRRNPRNSGLRRWIEGFHCNGFGSNATTTSIVVAMA